MTQQSKSSSMVSGGLRRPSWICSIVKQCAVLVRDASPSMLGDKADEASDASEKLVSELARPENKDGFYAAVIDFAESARVVNLLDKATSIQGRVNHIACDSWTNITAGLQEALQILQTVQSHPPCSDRFLRPVVIVFTDGCHNTGPSPEPVADQLKQIADLVTVAFGDDADEGLMRRLASTPNHFYRCNDGRQLRDFFAAVGATMGGTLIQGINSTQALSQMQQ